MASSDKCRLCGTSVRLLIHMNDAEYEDSQLFRRRDLYRLFIEKLNFIMPDLKISLNDQFSHMVCIECRFNVDQFFMLYMDSKKLQAEIHSKSATKSGMSPKSAESPDIVIIKEISKPNRNRPMKPASETVNPVSASCSTKTTLVNHRADQSHSKYLSTVNELIPNNSVPNRQMPNSSRNSQGIFNLIDSEHGNEKYYAGRNRQKVLPSNVFSVACTTAAESSSSIESLRYLAAGVKSSRNRSSTVQFQFDEKSSVPQAAGKRNCTAIDSSNIPFTTNTPNKLAGFPQNSREAVSSEDDVRKNVDFQFECIRVVRKYKSEIRFTCIGSKPPSTSHSMPTVSGPAQHPLSSHIQSMIPPPRHGDVRVFPDSGSKPPSTSHSIPAVSGSAQHPLSSRMQGMIPPPPHGDGRVFPDSGSKPPSTSHSMPTVSGSAQHPLSSQMQGMIPQPPHGGAV